MEIDQKRSGNFFSANPLRGMRAFYILWAGQFLHLQLFSFPSQMPRRKLKKVKVPFGRKPLWLVGAFLMAVFNPIINSVYVAILQAKVEPDLLGQIYRSGDPSIYDLFSPGIAPCGLVCQQRI